MEKIFIVLLIVFVIIAMVSPFLSGDKINKYIQEQNGELISTNSDMFRYRHHNAVNKHIYIKYYDKNRNIRAVTLHIIGPHSNFSDDRIIEYDTNSDEYKQLKKKTISDNVTKEKRAASFDEKKYQTKDKEVLFIKQEFTNPNIGEHVFIANRIAPNGKYKLGFMNYIIVKNGIIESITMF